MRKSEPRLLSFLLAAALCMSVFTFPTFAAYESDESGGTEPPEYIGSVITITSEEMGVMPDLPEDGEAEPEPNPEPDLDNCFESLLTLLLSGEPSGDVLTPEGNLTLVDDILQGSGENGKQFLTVTTKKGNYFYLVIDRSGEKDNVHFLNQVDESDLLALMEDGDAKVEPAVCTCKDKCYAGHVDTSCPICAANMTECIGKAPEPTPTPAPASEPEAPAKKSTPGKALALLILALGGGTAFYFVKIKGKGLPFGKQKSDGGGFRETANEEAEDDFYEFERSDEEEDEETGQNRMDSAESDGDAVPFFPDDGEYWPEDEKDVPTK